MLKLLLFYLNILHFTTLNEGKFFKKGHLNHNTSKDETWQNLWFPHPSNYKNDMKPEAINVETAASSGGFSDKGSDSEWPGLWFPYPPNYKRVKKINKDNGRHDCDNGKDNLSVDFDPQDKRHSYNYICLDNKSKYAPNLNTSALMREYIIPYAYVPPVKCLNETIEYTESLPTFGAYRPLLPKYGSYKYLPPQRWLHSLDDGAIVFLYHPCALESQKEHLKNTLKGCLYRHIITPSQLLTPEYPLALLAWGKSLQMSVVDDTIAVQFIKDSAKKGSRHKQRKLLPPSNLYDASLLTESHLVTDEQDSEICGYKEIR